MVPRCCSHHERIARKVLGGELFAGEGETDWQATPLQLRFKIARNAGRGAQPFPTSARRPAAQANCWRLGDAPEADVRSAARAGRGDNKGAR